VGYPCVCGHTSGYPCLCPHTHGSLYDESCLIVTVTSKIEPVPEVYGKEESHWAIRAFHGYLVDFCEEGLEVGKQTHGYSYGSGGFERFGTLNIMSISTLPRARAKNIHLENHH